MTAYIILFFISIFPVIAKKKPGNGYYVMQCLLFILVAGLRNHVGGDTLGYMSDWEIYPPIQDLNLIYFITLRYQPGWIILNCLCKSISQDFFILQLIIACFVNISIFYIVKKYSPDKYFTILLYLLLSYCYFNFEILRESIAACIFLFAFQSFYNKNWLKYYILITIGFLFHDGIIIFSILPIFYKFVTTNISLKKYGIIIIIIISFVLFNPIVINNLLFLLPGNSGESFMNSYGKESIGSFIGQIRYVVTLTVYVAMSMSGNFRKHKYILAAFFLFVCIQFLGFLLPVFSSRVANYMKIYYFIAVTVFLVGYKDNILKIALIMLMSFSFFNYYFSNVTSWTTPYANVSSNKYYLYEIFVPYYSIFEDPDNNVMERRQEIYNQTNNQDN